MKVSYCSCERIAWGYNCQWDLKRDGLSWREQSCCLYLRQGWRIVRFEPFNKNTRLIGRMRVRMSS